MYNNDTIFNNIIVKETPKGNGIYIIDVDQDKALTVEGNDYREKVTNAIHDFLKQPDTESYTLNPR